ncbi:MAG TPA: hypothetical protein VN946_10735 [Terriglobales bacterium]|jgi:hypothetical protein|nr:hypothetical protein [Terriglobales bacterium]
MSRTFRCKICADPAISGQVNAMLETGVRMRIIAEQTPGFSSYQLAQHKRRCLAPPIAESSSDATADDLQLWMQRCTDSYHLAIANGDSRSAIAAISAATRGLSQLAKKQERDAEAVSEQQAADDPNRPTTIAELDQLVSDYAERAKTSNFCNFCQQPISGREHVNHN